MRSSFRGAGAARREGPSFKVPPGDAVVSEEGSGLKAEPYVPANTTRRAAIAGVAAVATMGAAPASLGRARPQRIVSLNSCLDVILTRVADRAQIAGLSHYSQERDASSLPSGDRDYHFLQGTAEEVVALAPDLVLVDTMTAPATRNALRRLGARTETFVTPETVADSLAQVRRIGALAGHPERGEAEVARIEAALRAAAPLPGQRRPRALIFQRGGFASGPGTLMDEMLNRTGFTNAMVSYGYRRSSDVPLERVAADPPDLLLSGEPSAGAASWGERVMSHPSLSRASRRMRVVTFPAHLMYCGGPNLARTAGILADARRQVLGGAA